MNSLKAANSLVNIRRTVLNDDETLTQYNIYMANFDVSLSTSTIYAELYSRVNVGPLMSFGKQAIFRADVPGVIGGTGGNIVVDTAYNFFDATGHASGSLAGSLRMNAATADIVLTSLGLSTAATDPVAILVRTANWGHHAGCRRVRGARDFDLCDVWHGAAGHGSGGAPTRQSRLRALSSSLSNRPHPTGRFFWAPMAWAANFPLVKASSNTE